jgi:hypothetical protein
MGPEPGTKVIARAGQKRVITFDENDYPVVIVQPSLTKEQIKSVYFIAAAEPFVIDDRPDEVKFRDMTIAEVLVRKQMETAIRTGDVDAIERIMDRLIDKPLSRSENLNMNASYEDALKNIAEKANASKVIEIVDDIPDKSIFGDLVD